MMRPKNQEDFFLFYPKLSMFLLSIIFVFNFILLSFRTHDYIWPEYSSRTHSGGFYSVVFGWVGGGPSWRTALRLSR